MRAEARAAQCLGLLCGLFLTLLAGPASGEPAVAAERAAFDGVTTQLRKGLASGLDKEEREALKEVAVSFEATLVPRLEVSRGPGTRRVLFSHGWLVLARDRLLADALIGRSDYARCEEGFVLAVEEHVRANRQRRTPLLVPSFADHVRRQPVCRGIGAGLLRGPVTLRRVSAALDDTTLFFAGQAVAMHLKGLLDSFPPSDGERAVCDTLEADAWAVHWALCQGVDPTPALRLLPLHALAGRADAGPACASPVERAAALAQAIDRGRERLRGDRARWCMATASRTFAAFERDRQTEKVVATK